MNERLAEFLMSLVRDPDKMEAFNDDETVRSSIVHDADLLPSEKEALLSGDAAAILALLQAGEEDGLTWVGIPRIKFVEGEPIPRIKFTVGFALFGRQGSSSTASRSGGRAGKTRPPAKSAKGTGRSTAKRSTRVAAKSSKAARSAAKRRR
jgi:hypothetical protein